MDMTHSFWEENSNIQRVKYESCNSNDETPTKLRDDRGLYPFCDTNLNFSTATCSEDDSEYGNYKKSKVARQDPMSHRIIEKRRRDRMNNCLADLSRLIPTEYLKKGRGRIEKTEIIEMAIKHMKFLQDHNNPKEHYRLGYQECMSETMRFMVEVEGHFPREAICVRLLNHLQKHCETITHGTAVLNHTNQSFNELHHPFVGPHMIEEIHRNVEITNGHQRTKAETEPNNNSNSTVNNYNHHNTNEMECAKLDNNCISYKYKNNIKMRFNQDVSAGGTQDEIKQSTAKNGRSSSVTSTENQSSSRSSPPSSEMCTRISDSENINRRSPSDCALSITNHPHMKVEQNVTDCYSPTMSKQNQIDVKHNFNIPIFVLHAKGSYYVPLTIDYKTLLPYLQHYDLLEVVPGLHSVILHPVTINVNFQANVHNYANNLKPSRN